MRSYYAHIILESKVILKFYNLTATYRRIIRSFDTKTFGDVVSIRNKRTVRADMIIKYSVYAV